MAGGVGAPPTSPYSGSHAASPSRAKRRRFPCLFSEDAGRAEGRVQPGPAARAQLPRAEAEDQRRVGPGVCVPPAACRPSARATARTRDMASLALDMKGELRQGITTDGPIERSGSIGLPALCRTSLSAAPTQRAPAVPLDGALPVESPSPCADPDVTLWNSSYLRSDL